MAVKIRLKRMGKIRAPYYRVVVMDSRAKRDGRAIEEIGLYHPTEEPSRIEIISDRAQYWLGVGAQPTEQVAALLKITGDWQKFKGEPGAEGTLKVAEPKPDKRAIFEEAARKAALEPKDSGRKKPAKAEADAPQASTPAAEKTEEAPASAEPTEATAPVESTEATEVEATESAEAAGAAEGEAAPVEESVEAAAPAADEKTEA